MMNETGLESLKEPKREMYERYIEEDEASSFEGDSVSSSSDNSDRSSDVGLPSRLGVTVGENSTVSDLSIFPF